MAVDYFLELTGIEGESKSKHHPKQIDVVSWHWGAANEPPGTGSGRQRKVEEFTFVHRLDKASPLLLNAVAQNAPIAEAILTVELLGTKPLDYATYTMTNVLVTMVAPSAEGSASPVEEVALAFRELELSYRPRKPNGSLGSAITGSISWIDQA